MKTKEQYIKEFEGHSEDVCFQGLQDLFWELMSDCNELRAEIDKCLRDSGKLVNIIVEKKAIIESMEKIMDNEDNSKPSDFMLSFHPVRAIWEIVECNKSNNYDILEKDRRIKELEAELSAVKASKLVFVPELEDSMNEHE